VYRVLCITTDGSFKVGQPVWKMLALSRRVNKFSKLLSVLCWCAEIWVMEASKEGETFSNCLSSYSNLGSLSDKPDMSGPAKIFILSSEILFAMCSLGVVSSFICGMAYWVRVTEKFCCSFLFISWLYWMLHVGYISKVPLFVHRQGIMDPNIYWNKFALFCCQKWNLDVSPQLPSKTFWGNCFLVYPWGMGSDLRCTFLLPLRFWLKIKIDAIVWPPGWIDVVKHWMVQVLWWLHTHKNFSNWGWVSVFLVQREIFVRIPNLYQYQSLPWTLPV